MGRFSATAYRAPAPVPEPVASPPAAPAPQLTVLPKPEVPPPPAVPPAAAKPKPKLDFGGLQKKEAAAVPTSDYPVLPDPDGTMAAYATAFLEAHAAEEAATGAKEAARLELISVARPSHFKIHSGHAEVPSFVSVLSPKGGVRVTFKDAYKKLDEAKFGVVKNVIGEKLDETYLTQTFEFSIKSEKIPDSKMQEVIDGLRELAIRLGIVEAVAVATCYKPTAEWHTARFRHLTPEQNIRLEGAVDREKGYCTASVGPARGGKK